MADLGKGKRMRDAKNTKIASHLKIQKITVVAESHIGNAILQ